MAANHDAEIESIWLPINRAWIARMDRFTELCMEHNIVEDIWELLNKDEKLMEAVRKLPAHVVDQVRAEIPMTATQLRLYYDNAREKGLYIADYDTF